MYGISLNISLLASTCVSAADFSLLRLSTQITSLKNQLFQLGGTVAKNCDLTSKENRSFHTKLLLLMSERGEEGCWSTSRESF